ncbi:SDR family oxidoreductase [Micromonospora polyrhachis]|uniref:NAD(P)-dependent dehydrogenase (Short-subunit alcohol dehydrogenase family) n=1 Tax=Micromonospora polyrhachis TaxID=1282883 RepID=A0A7W7WMP2_9ACTN|nr:SDR family oxidoreductase [Micromonospora polyrhachis]MBB4956343.1 NAD(P)-dependent dehydrogenase (short-subunit alcohol dehydrogenase family) [Micromonospora polyrhachis]
MTPVGLDLDDAVVVVTGGASGIGAALAERFVAAGARVVVNDLDVVAAERVAARIGALAIAGDAADADFVDRLVERVWTEYGALDLFCANIGIAPAGGLDASDETWARAWQVNVLSQVYAARALLPNWLADGQGRLLVTVSAAGLLTMLGNAPYSVTKHAALSLAEWLRASYEHRGITVQALCPQGVRTPMLARSGTMGSALLDDGALSADEVADAVLEALTDDRFLVLPHTEVADFYLRRAADPDRWLRAMNRLQQRHETARDRSRSQAAPAPPQRESS